MFSGSNLDLQASWRALLTEKNSFLNVTFLDEEDFAEPMPLRRYRSEPDLSKVWRQAEATEIPRIMINQLESKKGIDDDASSVTDTESCQSCQSSQATTMTREPNSDSESVAGLSNSSFDLIDERVKTTSWADMSEEPHCAQPVDGSEVPGRGGKKIRPCKAKRMRCRKFMEKLKKEVEFSPETFSMDHVELPQSLFFNNELRDRFEARLQTHQLQVLRVREQQTNRE
jgi:hypothetical protein